MPEKQPTEDIIKCMVLQHFRKNKTINHKTLIASEYFLGISGKRIDLAISNDELLGIEIKSKFDSLRRLDQQVKAYEKCFDKVIVIADEKHIPNIPIAVSKSADIWSLNKGENFQIISQSTRRNLNTQHILKLFEKSDLLRLIGAPQKTKISRADAYNLATSLPEDIIGETYRQIFRRKFSQTSAAFWRAVGQRKISVSHLHELRRFKEAKLVLEEKENTAVEFWKKWTELAKEAFQKTSI